MPFKAGYAALVGRPNVGKSTLLNAIIGERLSIVTPKPQTTRHRIAGIYNADDAQVVFLDTPGFHIEDKPLNAAMNEVVDSVISDSDVVAVMVEAGQAKDGIERGLFDRIGRGRAIVVVNKCDRVARGEYDGIAASYREGWGAEELVILSALKGDGVATLVEAIKARMPEGPALFPTDIYTEHPVRFIAAELIREQVFCQMQEEIPYAAAVEIAEFKDATPERPVTVVRATIVVEKESQKGMVIGKGGRRIKEIGKRARERIEALVGGKAFLDLSVRVERGWTKDREKIAKLGYSRQV